MVRYLSILLFIGLAWGQKSYFYLPKIDLFGFDIEKFRATLLLESHHGDAFWAIADEYRDLKKKGYFDTYTAAYKGANKTELHKKYFNLANDQMVELSNRMDIEHRQLFMDKWINKQIVAQKNNI